MNDRRGSLNHHRRDSGNLVDEPPYDVSERTKSKLYLALGFMILLIYILYAIVRPLGLPPSYDDLEPTHDLTLWAEPENYTYHVRIEFYGSQQDAIADHNRLAAASPMVRPDMSNMTESCIYYLPRTPNLFWVRVGCSSEVEVEIGEWTYALCVLRIGEPLRLQLEGHDLTILVTRAQIE